MAIVPAASADEAINSVGFNKTVPHTPHIEALANGLGMETEDLIAELQSGKTLYEIGLEHGVEQEDLDEFYKHLRPKKQTAIYLANQFNITVEELKSELQSGKTVQELADEHNVDFDELMTTGINYWRVDAKIRFHHKIAMELGMTDAELREELNSGTTLKDLAEEYNLDLSDYKKEEFTKKDRKVFNKLAEELGMTSEELVNEIRPEDGSIKEYIRNHGYNLRELQQDIEADRQANQN